MAVKSLFKAVVLVAVFSVITRFLGFLFRIYLSRELGAEMLGIYQVALSVFMVLVVLVSSGLPLAVSKMTARFKVSGDARAANAVATGALLIGLILSVVLCLLIFLLRGAIGHIFTDYRCMEILLTLLPAVIASAVYSAFRGSLWGQRDYFSVGWTELAEQILRIVFFVIMLNFFFVSTDGATIAGWSMSLACVCSAILATWVYWKKGGRLASPRGYFKPVLKSSVPVTGVRTVSSLIQPVIAVLFPLMLVASGATSETALSLFGVAMGMTFPLLFLPSTVVGALSFTLIPELSTALVQKQHQLVQERVKTSLIFSVVISAMVIPFYMGLGSQITEFLFANQLSGEFLARAAWIMVPLGLSNITSSILNSFNLEVRSFINNLLGGIVLLLFVVALTGLMEVYALIWGFGACMTITTVLNITMIKKHIGLKLGLLKPMLLMAAFAVVCALLAKWVYGLCALVFPMFLSLSIGAVVAVGGFVLLCICFRLCDFAMVFSKIKKTPKFSRKKV